MLVRVFLLQQSLKAEWVLPGAAKMIGLPPWIRMTDGHMYYEDEEDGLETYWRDYLDEDVGQEAQRRMRLGGGGLMREDGVHLRELMQLLLQQ